MNAAAAAPVAPAATFDPTRTALIVIDLQRDFLDPRGYAAQAGLDVARLRGVIGPVQRLLAAARARGLTVVHTREGHVPDLSDCPPQKLARSVAAGAPIGHAGPLGRLLVRGEAGHDWIAEAQPAPGEWRIDKPGYSAFHRTDLAERLHAAGVEALVLCGVTTEVCVHSTLRAAIDLGWPCTLVADACAASEPQHQAPALSMVGVEGGLFGRVADSATVITTVIGDWHA
jgi:nicotinamidase-related amidase